MFGRAWGRAIRRRIMIHMSKNDTAALEGDRD